MVELRVNIAKKDLWLISAICVLIVGLGVVVAYNVGMSGGIPDEMGHSSDEVDVNIVGQGVMGLQDAINAGYLGNGSGGGGGVQSYQVVGNTDISNTGTWTDMSGMTQTITTGGGDILLMFSAGVYGSNYGNADFRFLVDGNPVYNTYYGDHLGQSEVVSFQWLEVGLSAGSHIFRVQWKSNDGYTAYQDGVTKPRVFTILEFINGGGSSFIPSIYDGSQESITFPNGMIMKIGEKTEAGTSGQVVFGTPFPNGAVSVTATVLRNAEETSTVSIDSLTTSGFNFYKGSVPTGIYWTAIGY